MATITRRGNSYRITASIGYSNTGKQIRRSMTWVPPAEMSTRQIEKEVQKQAVLFEQECLKGQIITTIKFDDFVEKWFSEYAAIKLKPQTIRGYQWIATRVSREIGHLRMDKITPRHIQRMIINLGEEKRLDNKKLRNGKLSAKSIKLHVSFVSTVFTYGMKMQIVSANPCRNVTLPKPDSIEKEIYTLEEAQQILDLLKQEGEKNYKYYVFYVLAMFCGLRLGELLGLEWGDCDFLNNTISIKRTSMYCKSQGGTYTDTPKTKSSIRCLKVQQDVMELLLSWRELQNRQKKRVGSKWTETNRIFTKWNGLVLDRTAPSHFFRQFCERTGIRYLSNHCFRHFNASAMILNGIDLKTVQARLGHSTAATTMSVYLHSFQSAQAAAVNAISSVVKIK